MNPKLIDTPPQERVEPFDRAAFDETFAHRTEDVGGVRLHYVVGGKGEPVVLLHGWPTTWYEWRRVMPKLAEGYTVIAPDLRGLGDSDKPLSGYGKKAIANEVFALCQKLGHKRAFVVGHDWGTSVAFALCHEHPEFVRKVAFTDNVIPGLLAGDKTWDDLNSHFWHHHLHAEPDLPELLIAGRERAYLTWFYRKLTHNLSAFTDDYTDEFVRAYTLPGSLRAGMGYYQALADDAEQNQAYAKTRLLMPALVVTAEQTVNDMLHKQVQPVAEDYRGVIFKRCGHFIPVERPDDLLALLLPFLAEGKK